jgi:flagellar hook-associated protein 1
MSLTGTLNTVQAGLQVTQAALGIVGANVSNAQTPGYVRKTLTQETTAAGTSISVRTAAIDRELDTLVQSQLRQASSGGSYADKLDSLYQQLQTLYGAPGAATSLDTVYNNFTTALQDLSVSPSSGSAQSSAVNAAQLLAKQLNAISSNIQSMRTAAEQGIAADVQAANQALQEIAKLNLQVSTAVANDPTTATLLDQRDAAIDKLATLMDVRVVPGQYNQVSVYTGSGMQLVGATAVTLGFNAQGTLTPTQQWNADPTKSGVGTITLTTPGGTPVDLIASGAIQSGEIAAYLQMRDKILPQAQSQLDELAAQISQAASNATTQGTAVTVAGQAGFTVDTSGLQSGNIIHLTYTDASSVQHSVSIVRVDDPSVLPLPDTTTADPNDKVIGINFGGGPLSASVITQLATALGASGLQFSASGNTLQVLGNTTPVVTVNSLSETDTITTIASGKPQLPLFVDATGAYTGAIPASGPEETGFAQRIAVNASLLSNPNGLVAYSGLATTAGDNARPTFLYNQLTSAASTFSPVAGIGSVASPFSGTLPTFIGQIMTQQGQAAANASSLKNGQDVVVNALQQRMNTTSGVSVDQEMTNLLNLQNTYAANARVFSVVPPLFQTVLQM